MPLFFQTGAATGRVGSNLAGEKNLRPARGKWLTPPRKPGYGSAMTAFEPNGIGESQVTTDGKSISITLDTADSGLITLNLPLPLSGHLIRVLTARTREAHERLQKAGEKTDFLSEIADVKTLSVGGAKNYPHPILSLETQDGVVTAYHVPTNIMQRLAIGLTQLFSGDAKRK